MKSTDDKVHVTHIHVLVTVHFNSSYTVLYSYYHSYSSSLLHYLAIQPFKAAGVLIKSVLMSTDFLYKCVTHKHIEKAL